MPTLSSQPPVRRTAVVRIIWPEPVLYYVNGVDAQRFDPGECYEVALKVAQGMIDRKWARIATDKDFDELENDEQVLDMRKVKSEDKS